MEKEREQSSSIYTALYPEFKLFQRFFSLVIDVVHIYKTHSKIHTHTRTFLHRTPPQYNARAGAVMGGD